MKQWILLVGVVALTGTALLLPSPVPPTKKEVAESVADEITVDKAALERSRHTVKMLDDIYKTAVVLITDKYVHDEDDFPAGSAAIALFDHVTEKGWHEVRLIDATGDPYDDDNVAQDEFERRGIQKLLEGETFVDRVVTKDGKSYLRAMTPVPVVMEKCIMCHAHYEDVPEGQAIGAISYTLPIE